ncbi:MAG: helix-turn-helix domain-containing protein [Solirubrobacteraceae bacterium]|nr:helix-turn-helix domain-containing protein [Solirubrobacteraceae bacterium]
MTASYGSLTTPVADTRALHLDMLSATMSGQGLQGIAELAHARLGTPVAIVVPRLRVALAPVEALEAARLAEVCGHVFAWIEDGGPVIQRGDLFDGILRQVAVRTTDEVIGAVLQLGDGVAAPDPTADEVLQTAAVAAVTELAVAVAREHNGDVMRSSLIQEIRAEPSLSAEEIVRRGKQVGVDLTDGAIALCAEITGGRLRYALDVLRTQQPGVLAELHGTRIYALVPTERSTDPSSSPVKLAQAISDALEPYGPVAFSSFRRPQMFQHSIREAEVVLALLEHEDVLPGKELDTPTYRLLFSMLAAQPDEVTRLYEETIAPLVRYDDQYSTELVATVASYLEHRCNTNATAAAMFAHRHTIAYRLERVRELTQLDLINRSEHRERIGIGLKAYRLLAPRLERSARYAKIRDSVASAAS